MSDTDPTDPAGVGVGTAGTLLVVVDPTWEATAEEPDPPLERMMGGWVVVDDEATGDFFPNPAYAPASPDSPTDPVDAVLRQLVRGETDGDEVVAMLDTIRYGVALDDEGAPLIVPAPDGLPSLVVTTAPWHRERVVEAADWTELGLPELAVRLFGDAVDVLLNPGGPASMRVVAGVVRDAARASIIGRGRAASISA